MLQFYDFEVFKYDWLVVLIDPINRTEQVIVNDKAKLEDYYNEHKNNIWIGYNSRGYDQWILKSILCGFNPKEMNDYIIVKRLPGYKFSNLLWKFDLINYDVMPNPPIGLKTLEGFMGNDIKETDVPFNIDRKLTPNELSQTIKYCRHDVEQTIEVFLRKKSEFDSKMTLVKQFKLPLKCIDETEARITARILGCTRTSFKDEFDIEFLDCIKLNKYKYIKDWFANAKNDCTNEMKELYETAKESEKWKYNWNDSDRWSYYYYSRSLTVNVAGVPHTFGFGGLHGATGYIDEKGVVQSTPIHRKGLILHVDVNSYYPSILIEHKLITRAASTPETYEWTYKHRLELKRQKKKKEQLPFKKILNALSGAMKDKNNPAYDPRNNNMMCINGQLMLLDLIEKLEVVPGFELIQSNTDGLIIQIPDTDNAFEQVDDICYEWEQRTQMGLGLDIINEIYQKDVNNYLWIDEGSGERKGAYVKELSDLDNDLPIINKALVDYMSKKIPVEVTINNCDDLIMFQKLVKLSDKYKWVEHEEQPRNKRFDYKCYRVFASNRPGDGRILKCDGKRNPAKFGNTPDKSFVFNDDVVGVKVPEYLDKLWYIELAKDRLKQYGVEV